MVVNQNFLFVFWWAGITAANQSETMLENPR